jgi:hypothetical protein
MTPASQPKKFGPAALTGKVLALNGAIFIVLAALLGGYILLFQPSTAPGRGNAFGLVAGILAVVFAGVGLALVVVGLLLWRFAGASPSASVVNDFFAAMQKQDYTAAFQCLDANMQLGQGQTPAHFVESAQTIDAAQGQVTKYALSGVQANRGRRIFTVKVTRLDGSYRTRLYVQQQGAGWKIVGLDRL